MIRTITFFDLFLKKVDFRFQINISKNLSIGIFETYFTCHCCPEAIMKKFLQITCIFIDLEVLDNITIFSGIVRRLERGSFVCKHIQIEEAKFESIYLCL